MLKQQQQRVSQRQKKPTNFEERDLGYVEKDQKKVVRTTTNWREAQSKCEQIIQLLRKQPGADFFSQPPDPQHPYYTDIMTNYIDLAIVEKKLKNGEYVGSFSFVQDIRNVFDKAFRYYPDNIAVITRTRELAQLFDSRVKEIEQMPLKDVLTKGQDQFGAISDLKNTIGRYQKEIQQKVPKDQLEKVVQQNQTKKAA